MSAERPRYLVLTELFLPTKGGTAVWFDEVYRRLGDRGTHVLTAAVPGAEAHDLTHPNTIHRLALQRSRWMRPASLPMYARFLGKALALAARQRFDAVHAGRVLPEGLIAVAVGRLARLPVVIYAHGEEITAWGRVPKRRRAMRFAYRRATCLIANSQFTRDQLIALGVDPARITIIYPGVDLGRFRPGLDAAAQRASIGLAPGERLILSVGRLTRRKGFDQLIRAVARLRGRGLVAHLAVIGTGDDRGYLEQLAGQEGVSELVHLCGHVPPEDLPRWYNAADLFAMPNRAVGGDTEGFGIVFLEAAACARPAIAGRAGGTGDAVLDGETGLRVEGDSLDEVTRAIERILGEPGLAERLARRAYERATTRFSWDEVARRTLGLGCHRANAPPGG
jgi:phosphatidylinositol alpha-1,6-mannosyltransferase